MTESFRVRGDAFFVRTATGATVYHGTGSFSVAHQHAHDLLSALARLLDGTRSVDSVLAALPEPVRPAAGVLLDSLRRNGFLVAAGSPVGPRPAWMVEKFADHLDYLAQFPGDPYSRLVAVRVVPAAVVGSGPLLRAAAGALADHAFARVRLVTDDRDAVAPVLAAVAERDPEAEWTVATDPGDARVILHAGTYPDSVGLVGVLHARADRIVGAVLDGDEWCWECAVRTLGAEGPSSSAVPAPAACLAAFQVAHRLYRRLACPDETPDRTAVTVDPDTLTSSRHTLWRHPDCSHHPGLTIADLGRDEDETQVRPDVVPRESIPNAEAVRITAAVRSWTDPVAGPLLAVGEDDLPQLPLATSRCRTALGEVVRSGPWAREARVQAVLGALAVQGARLLGADGHVGAGWSVAEARYRARVALSAELTPDPVRTWGLVDGGRTPLTAFLLATLGADGVEAAAVRLPTGLWHAKVRTDRVLASGIGISASHAEDNALLAAVTSNPVHLAPPVKTWTEALCANRSDLALSESDLTGAVPFVGTAAAVVAIRPEPR
ncbi:hypothetical protein [Actinokineospora inagensis]|uniref:hypothetical protein n=1 Tax=Actinokineospora inagensis TaxID=103730 RepID=UPI0003FC8862|nr:hypothetical protein [Actinokineospora inagensis]